MSKTLLHTIYQVINDNPQSALNQLNNIDLKEIDPKFHNSYNSLKIRALILQNNYDAVIDLFNSTSITKSSDYILLLKYLNGISSELSFDYFKNNVLQKILLYEIKLTPNNVDELIVLNNREILKSLVGFSLKTTINGTIMECDDIMFDVKQLDPIITNISNCLKNKDHVIKVFKRFNYELVIDGGNYLYRDGKLNNNSYKNLLKFSSLQNKPTLLILNTQHRSKINQFINFYPNKLLKIYYTPMNCDDDLYIILASLIKQTKIITNDQYKNHNDVFSSNNILKHYLTEKTINTCLYNYSIVRQNAEHILIPSTKKGFVII